MEASERTTWLLLLMRLKQSRDQLTLLEPLHPAVGAEVREHLSAVEKNVMAVLDGSYPS